MHFWTSIILIRNCECISTLPGSLLCREGGNDKLSEDQRAGHRWRFLPARLDTAEGHRRKYEKKTSAILKGASCNTRSTSNGNHTKSHCPKWNASNDYKSAKSRSQVVVVPKILKYDLLGVIITDTLNRWANGKHKTQENSANKISQIMSDDSPVEPLHGMKNSIILDQDGLVP